MSDTDKTKPLWVLLRDGHHKAAPSHGVHDERGCDLPAEPQRDWNTRCRWMFIYSGTRLCNCGLCSGAAYEGSRSKKARSNGKREIAAQIADGHE